MVICTTTTATCCVTADVVTCCCCWHDICMHSALQLLTLYTFPPTYLCIHTDGAMRSLLSPLRTATSDEDEEGVL